MNNILQEGKSVPEATLEERVVKLERLVEMVLQHVDVSVRKKDWRRTVGMLDDDPLIREIIEEGQRIREADRRKASL